MSNIPKMGHLTTPVLADAIPTPLKNDGVSNSWDDDIPNIWKNKIHVPNHQPVYNRYIYIWKSVMNK